MGQADTKKDRVAQSEQLLKKLEDHFGSTLVKSQLSLGDAEICIDRKDILSVFTALKETFHFDLFLNVTAVDYMDSEFMPRVTEDRFELVYLLMSISTKDRLRIKAGVPEEDPTADTVVELWKGANFMEREVWDMFGITFNGHPDLRRILNYEEFKGHPLRKDYPLQGKQPRIPLRSPEVSNTARNMTRPSLISINKRHKTTNAG